VNPASTRRRRYSAPEFERPRRNRLPLLLGAVEPATFPLRPAGHDGRASAAGERRATSTSRRRPAAARPCRRR
jgi:hypothetical protein